MLKVNTISSQSWIELGSQDSLPSSLERGCHVTRRSAFWAKYTQVMDGFLSGKDGSLLEVMTPLV